MNRFLRKRRDLDVPPDRYNPEEGDVDERAPDMGFQEQALSLPVPPDRYNPEEGDVDERAPDMGEAAGQDLAVAPDSYNPEEGDVDARAPDMSFGARPPAPRRPRPAQVQAPVVPPPAPTEQAPVPSVPAQAPAPARPSAVTRAVQAPVTTASVQKQPPQVSKVDAGPKPRSGLQSLFRQLPGGIANVFAATKANNEYGQPILAGIQDRVDRGRQMSDEDHAERQSYGKRKGYLERQAKDEAKEDSRYAEGQARLKKKDARQDKLDAKEDAKDDPTSRHNRTLQAAFRQAYPEEAAAMSQADLDNITEEDMKALGLVVDTAKTKRKTAAEGAQYEKERTDKIVDFEKQEQIRKKYRKGAMSPYADPKDVAADMATTRAAVAAEFGGDDKIPAPIAERLRLAFAIREPRRREAMVDRVLAAAQAEKNKDDTSAKGDAQADFKENQAYLKAIQAPNKLEDITDSVAEASGVDLDKLDPNKDKPNVPGVGPIENKIPAGVYGAMSYLPDSLGGEYGRRGERVKAGIARMSQEELREATGLASTDVERRQLKEAEGLLLGGSEAQVMEAVKYVRDFSRRKKAEASRAFPNAAEQFNAMPDNPPVRPNPNGSVQAPAKPPAAGPGVVPPPGMKLQKNPSTGEYRWAPR